MSDDNDNGLFEDLLIFAVYAYIAALFITAVVVYANL